MKKLAIIINGKPESGKDFLCDAVIKARKAQKYSSIKPIHRIAKAGGWDGVKDPAGRKLLSDLKHAFSEYNDLPNRAALESYRAFLRGRNELLFVHIREPEQIAAFRRAAGATVTLLIRRPGTGVLQGNTSDDGVEGFPYDETYDNVKTAEDAERDFCAFIDGLFEKYAREA
ncbi:MAG: hypothetical protein LBR72_08535 [Oscillospiraceae bacterium]|nr:hypothetical protein [Oscillospiraceae bacterium]